MNKDNASQYLPFVIALSEGRTIQGSIRPEGKNWYDFNEEVSFDEKPEFYRIKPELMEFYAIANDDKTDILSGVYKTREKAEKDVIKFEYNNFTTVIHMREIE